MKKLFVILGILLSTSLAFAEQGDPEGWKYVFHLEYTNGILSVDRSVKFDYDTIPTLWSGGPDPKTTDFYGVIVNFKGKEDARFGFDKPVNMVATEGKSLFDVEAPFFADANYVNFYTKAGRKLFTVSLKESSFCDDNNKCNSAVGENYLNCPNDCPPPPPPPPTVEPTPPPTQPTVEPTPSPEASPTTGTITKLTEQFPTQKTSNTKIILIAGAGIIMLILAYTLWRIQRSME